MGADTTRLLDALLLMNRQNMAVSCTRPTFFVVDGFQEQTPGCDELMCETATVMARVMFSPSVMIIHVNVVCYVGGPDSGPGCWHQILLLGTIEWSFGSFVQFRQKLT